MWPSFQSDGKVSEVQILVMRGSSISAVRSGSDLSTSAGMLSGPAALLFFRDFIAFLISCFEGGFGLMSSVSSAGVMSAATSGGGLFNSVEKCSTHLFSISLSVVRSLFWRFLMWAYLHFPFIS